MVKQQRRVSYNQQELHVLVGYYVFQMPFSITTQLFVLLQHETCGHFTSGYYV